MLTFIKRSLLSVISTFGYEILKTPEGIYQITSSTRLGQDLLSDVRFILKNRVDMVFDVGANIGQTALRYLTAFPNARIFSFEPDQVSFQRMLQNVARCQRVQAFNFALGSTTRTAHLNRYKMNETNSLLQKAEGAEDFVVDPRYFEADGTQEVAVTTVDAICAEKGIKRIDLLKIDTQGYEIEVLEGAKEMIDSLAIPLVYAEVCFIRYYESQPLFQDVYQYLYDRGYRLVGLYESGYLTHTYQVGGNALFVHKDFSKLSRRTTRWQLGRVAFG